MIFALVGNQNCGKTTLLTSSQAPINMWATFPELLSIRKAEL